MKLTMHKIDGINYVADSSELPFVFIVHFDQDYIIDSKIDVVECMLVNLDDENIQVGGCVNITRCVTYDEEVNSTTPKYLVTNALSDEDDLNTLIPGRYVLSGAVLGFRRECDNHSPFEIKAEMEIEIGQCT